MTVEGEIVPLVATHLDRYPASNIADVYKLLHQGVYGPGHSIPNKKLAREWLEHERDQVQPDRTLPLVESIHPAGAVVRLHLRPYLAYEAKVAPLLDAFVRSAQAVEGDASTLAAWWAIFAAQVAPGGRWADRFAAREAELFGRMRAEAQWAAVPHSPAFVRAYAPAYRVLTRDEAERLCARIDAPFAVI